MPARLLSRSVRLAAGAAALLAACGGDPASAPPRPALSLTASNLDSLYAGDYGTVVVHFPVPADSASPARVVDVTWTSSDTLVATVAGVPPSGGQAAGRVYPGAAGRATIRARVRNAAGAVAQAEAMVTVRGVYRLSVWPDTNALVPGLVRPLVARATAPTGSVGTTAGATWSSDAPEVAEVDAQGRVTAVAPGAATITATASSDRRATAYVVVRDYGGPLVFTALTAGMARSGNLVGWGSPYTCGLTSAGRAFCWGSNVDRNLGTTAVMDRCEQVTTYLYLKTWTTDTSRYQCSATPVEVDGGHRYAELSAYAGHACGATTAGEVYCWGGDAYGQVGDGRVTAFTEGAVARAPVRADASVRFRHVSVGADATCALTEAGAPYCWGHNDAVPLADPYPAGRPIPIVVGGAPGLLGVGAKDVVVSRPQPVVGAPALTAISVGTSHACGLTADGEAWCWGDNLAGELGDGQPFSACASATDTACYGRAVAPRRVAGPVRFRELRAGDGSTCGVDASGGLWCWGLVGVGASEPLFAAWAGAKISRVPTHFDGAAAFASLASPPRGDIGSPRQSCGLDAGGVLTCPRRSVVDFGGVLPGYNFRLVAIAPFPWSEGPGGCGLGVDGTARCWYPAADGARGDGVLTSTTDLTGMPARVVGQR